MSDLIQEIKNALLWVVNRSLRFSIFVFAVSLLPSADKPSPKLLDATISQIGTTVFAIFALCVFFWHMMKDEK